MGRAMTEREVESVIREVTDEEVRRRVHLICVSA